MSAPARSEVPWDRLSDTAQQTVVKLIAMWADERFTGRIEIDCSQGAVGDCRFTETWKPRKKASG